MIYQSLNPATGKLLKKFDGLDGQRARDGDNCNMVYGDAAAVLTTMIEAVRGLGAKAAA